MTSIFKNKPKEFVFDQFQTDKFRKRELVIRYGLIFLLACLSAWYYFEFPVASGNYILAFLVYFLGISMLWFGSMTIINFTSARYSIFKQPVRLLVIQISALLVFVSFTEYLQLIALNKLFPEVSKAVDKKEMIATATLITFLISSIYASIGFFLQWKKNLVKAEMLEKANLEARYEVLKTQVNPHFLFNSLNTLLSLVEGNSEAERYIETLSEFMRYILKTRDVKGVMLKEELEVAEQYMYLQKSRFQGKLEIEFEVPHDFQGFLVPPLTLQMLLENAIKHNEISNEHMLRIVVKVEDGSFLVVQNNLNKKLDSEPSTGIGLKNIQSRYLILHEMEIQVNATNETFIVKLPLV